MNEREAIEMALDLIESEFTTKGENKYSPDEVIEALRQALAQPEQEPHGWYIDGYGSVIGTEEPKSVRVGEWLPWYTTPPQRKEPEQEPVAWMHNHIKGNVIAHRPADIDRHPEHWTALYPEPKPCPTCEALARTVMLDQTYHDTTPPQRTWVGLTDEEREELMDTYDVASTDYAHAIEAKLKEKNT